MTRVLRRYNFFSCSGYVCFFFQAEDGIRDLVRSRGLGDVYKRQHQRDRCGSLSVCSPAGCRCRCVAPEGSALLSVAMPARRQPTSDDGKGAACLLYTSDAADERSSVDLGGRRIIKKKKRQDAE